MTAPRYAVSVHTISLAADLPPRLLVPEPHRFHTLRAARGWLDTNAPTWRDPEVLRPTESGFLAAVLDEDGSEARAWEFPRDPSAPVVEHDREDLRVWKRARSKTTKTTTTAATNEEEAP